MLGARRGARGRGGRQGGEAAASGGPRLEPPPTAALQEQVVWEYRPGHRRSFPGDVDLNSHKKKTNPYYLVTNEVKFPQNMNIWLGMSL